MPSERPTKRSRVSRACDQCRTAREKCDGTQPACLTCVGAKRPCTYTAAPKKRGIQPGYIRTLELALTWLFQQSPESEVLLNRNLASEGNSSVLLSRDSRESNRLHKSWRKSRFCKDVDSLLSGVQLQPDGETSPVSDDEESDVEVEPTSQTSRIHPLPSPDHVLSNAFHRLPSTTPRDRPTPGTHRQSEASSLQLARPGEAIPLPNDSWRLLDNYFAYTQSWLPICEKHDLLRVSYSYPEAGLVLTTSRPDSGAHAELWSVLLVGAHQARLDRTSPDVPPDIDWIYSIARGMIPNESGSFDVGHVKALLNLVVIAIGQGNNQVAWLLVGSASRLITLLGRSPQVTSPRWGHVVAGCFLLESLLSLRLRKRPYLRRSDFSAVEEDGLEEWQPWAGPLSSPSAPPSRVPVLSLSSFNRLLDVVEVLASINSNSEPPLGHLLSELTARRSSLSPKFDYVTDQRKETPPNPPALLLLSTHVCSQFALNQSPLHVGYMLDLVERFRGQLGTAALPPPILCLLEHIQMSSAYSTIEPHQKARLEKIVSDIQRAWVASFPAGHIDTQITARAQATPQLGADQAPTPESIQIPTTAFTAPSNEPPSDQHRATTSLLEDLLPDMNPGTSTVHLPTNLPASGLPPIRNAFPRSSLSYNNLTAPPDLEMFFDELASLDGTEKLDSQPQFMQNLGFAPGASMADFFAGDSMLPTSFTPHFDGDLSHLHPEFFGAP